MSYHLVSFPFSLCASLRVPWVTGLLIRNSLRFWLLRNVFILLSICRVVLLGMEFMVHRGFFPPSILNVLIHCLWLPFFFSDEKISYKSHCCYRVCDESFLFGCFQDSLCQHIDDMSSCGPLCLSYLRFNELLETID